MTLLQIIDDLPKKEQAKTLFKAAFDALESGDDLESNYYFLLAVDIYNTIKNCNKK